MSDLFVGSTIAGCRLEAVAGRGGMGVVYRATQLTLARPVAVKAMAPQLAEDAEYRERFERESQLAASIDHPNVIPVYEAGEWERTLYLIMRWVDGTDLRALLGPADRLEPERAVRLLRPVASALAAAHRRGLVHRDIKPANVLIARGDDDQDEHVYLTDFGIAKRTDTEAGMTRTGVLVGTLDYTAPERIEGGKGTAASDIYAFGCMLFETLTGHLPFDRPTELLKMYAHLNDPVPSAHDEVPAVPPRLDAIIAKAMAKRPEDRYSSAGELVSALEHALEQLQTGDLHPEPPHPTKLASEPVPPTKLASEPVPPTQLASEPVLPTELEAEPPRPTLPTRPTAPAPSARRRSPALLAAPVAVLAVVAVVIVVLSGGHGNSGTAAGSASHAGAPAGTAREVQHATAGLVVQRTVPLSSAAGGIAADRAGNAWLALPASGELVRVAGNDGTMNSVRIGGRPTAAAVGDRGVWIADPSAGTLALFAGLTTHPIATLRLAAPASAIAADQSDGSAWAAEAGGTVAHVGPDGRTIAQTKVSPPATDIGAGEPHWGWVVNGTQALVRISPGPDGSQTTFDTHPGALAITFDRGAWVAHADGRVTRFDPRAGRLAVNADTPVAPTALDHIAAVDTQSSDSVWAISGQTRTLYRISNTTSPGVTGTAVFVAKPTALAVSDTSVWVTTSDGKVTEIQF